MSVRGPRPPRHLDGEAAQFWREVVRAYTLTEPQLKLLQGCCEAIQRVEQARDEIADEGAFISDRFGQRKASPAVDVERQAREQVHRHLVVLALDGDEPAMPAGRR